LSCIAEQLLRGPAIRCVTFVAFSAAAGLFLTSPAAAKPSKPVAPMSKRAETVYAQTHDLMQRTGDDVGEKMLALLMPVLREQPHGLLVGRLVVAAARLAHGPKGNARVDRLLRDADDNRDDKLKQFLAGVAVHYRGHGQATTRAAKRADYERAIRYLQRARPDLDHAPRLWIYLSVSYLRTGKQEAAEDAIDRAAKADGGEDADVYYCAAEVYHRKDPARAIKDIDRYLAIMKDNLAKGAYSAPEKEAGVRRMRDRLLAAVDGKQPLSDEELFDPIAETSLLPKNFDTGSTPTRLLALLLLVAPGLGVWWLKRRKSSGIQK